MFRDDLNERREGQVLSAVISANASIFAMSCFKENEKGNLKI